MKNKRLLLHCLILIIVFILVLSCCSCHKKEYPIATIIACSDFQHPEGHKISSENVAEILDEIKKDGIDSADLFFCCGDYDYRHTHNAAGIDSLKNAVSDIVTGNSLYIQGNHDDVIGSHGMTKSGNNDPENGSCGVYVINEDDYMWYNSNEERVKLTSQKLSEYLDAKIADGFDKPIFVLSHLPLHYSMRTKNNGDCKYADYIFKVLNAAGKELNIFFMYGHNHSNGWDDYLGGAAVYLSKSDKILIADYDTEHFTEQELNFTYFNPGYVGYYSNVNGADDALTMSVIKIYNDRVEISRYDKNGKHNMKSRGVRNDFKNETSYLPNLKVYPSTQTVYLS